MCDNFHLWFCCVDDMSFTILSEMKLSNATILSVKEIESRKFQKVKQSRTLQEYCWTLKSQLCLYVLDSFREVDRLVYSDADQYFFSNPKPLFDEWGTASMFMCSQRELLNWDRDMDIIRLVCSVLTRGKQQEYS